MTTIPSSNLPPSELPRIILLVDSDPDTLDMYATFLEWSGLSIAKAETAQAAFDQVDALQPEVIVADIGPALRPEREFVDGLKARPAACETPVIVLSSVPEAWHPAWARAAGDLCLLKPVSPDSLLLNIQRIYHRSRALRERSNRLLTHASMLAERSAILLGDGRGVAMDQFSRPCPRCGRSLRWIKRQSLQGVEYDHYQRCLGGCGLFCYDRPHRRWVKLL